MLPASLLAARTSPDQQIKVGGLLSLTGNWSDLGTQCHVMMQIGAEQMEQLLRHFNPRGIPATRFGGGVTFDLMIEDTLLDPATAASAAARLIAQGAQFIIGPQSSSEVAEVRKITDPAGVVQISPGSTASSLALPNDTVFRFVPADSLESKAVAELANIEGVKTIIPVWRADDGNRGLVNSLRTFAPPLGITVLPGTEYPTTNAPFSSVATSIAATVATAKAQLNLNQIAVYLAAFEEASDFLPFAATHSDLGGVKWYAGDGVALVSDYLKPGAAQFASQTRMIAPLPALPEETQQLRDPILPKLIAAGMPAPLPYAFAGYDAFVCATLAWVLAGGDRTAVSSVLPSVARTFMGTTGWTVLNAAGDREIADFLFYGIVSNQGSWAWKGLVTHSVSG